MPDASPQRKRRLRKHAVGGFDAGVMPSGKLLAFTPDPAHMPITRRRSQAHAMPVAN